MESVLQVGNFESAAQGMATTTLRAVIGGIMLEKSLRRRAHQQHAAHPPGEVTERWGVR
jgi:hypothetical protein